MRFKVHLLDHKDWDIVCLSVFKEDIEPEVVYLHMNFKRKIQDFK